MESVQHKFIFQLNEPQRLDVFVSNQLKDLTRSFVKKLITDGHVTVNGALPKKAGIQLSKGDTIIVVVPAPAPSNLIAEDIDISILYEDENVIVVNKSPGMVVHPSIGHSSGTLVHALLGHAPDIKGVGGVQRPGVVHRLDKDTSGLIIFAKNDLSHNHLQKQFKDRTVDKNYLTLVEGAPPTHEGKIEAPIGRDPRQRQRMAIMPLNKGRNAISEYSTIESFKNHTLLNVKILTGRTHQIRVHMAFVGCPVVGDRVYGFRKLSTSLKRQFLHAQKLSIKLLGAEEKTNFEAPLAADLSKLLKEFK